MQPVSFQRLDPAGPLTPWPDFPDSEIASGSRASAGLAVLDDPEFSLHIGFWEADANLGRWMDWPADEFMLMLDGEVVMVEPEGETVVGPGECFVIPQGRRCIWNQAAHARKLMLLIRNASAPAQGSSRPIIKLAPDHPMFPLPPMSPEILLGPAPAQQMAEIYRSASGQVSVGLWQSTGYRRRALLAARHEVMVLLKGEVRLTDDTGRSETFRPGDAVLVPKGANCAWESEGTVRKFFCTVGPATA